MKILNLSMIYQILKQLQINSSTIEKFKHKFKNFKTLYANNEIKSLLNYLNQFKSNDVYINYAKQILKIFYIE